jgi:hypothetical protein
MKKSSARSRRITEKGLERNKLLVSGKKFQDSIPELRRRSPRLKE